MFYIIMVYLIHTRKTTILSVRDYRDPLFTNATFITWFTAETQVANFTVCK